MNDNPLQMLDQKYAASSHRRMRGGFLLGRERTPDFAATITCHALLIAHDWKFSALIIQIPTFFRKPFLLVQTNISILRKNEA